MSFNVDLWNGFEIIKEKFNNTHRQIKAFYKLITGYVNLEREYCKSLDELFHAFKDTGNIDYPLEQSRLNIINMIDFESKRRKEFTTYVTKNIIDKITIYLSEPKISLDQHFLDAEELTTNFNKSLAKLISKQESFHFQCKELSSFLSQLELENNMNNKLYLPKVQKILSKVIKSRDEYLLYINETNIERDKYNFKSEELLNELEKTYRKTIDRFKEYLVNFAHQKYIYLQISYEKEKTNYEKYHSKIDLDQEELIFVMRNVTKEFPMTKIEFCPLKPNAIGKFIKSKYRDKLNEKDYNRILKSIQTYFQNHNIFPSNLIQTGISKISSKNQFDFFSTRRFTKKDKNYNVESSVNKLNTVQDKIRDKSRDLSPSERESIIMNNINFIKNFINELITNGKVKMFEDKLYGDDNIFKLDDKKDNRDKMDTNQKVTELFNLINISNESSSVYIETFIKTLSYLRSKGYFEINQFNYNLLQLIFIRILEENSKNDYMLKNILILAQTFYNIEGGEKIYLQKGIKDNEVLTRPETWHRCINYTICLANTEKDLTVYIKKSDLINKINKEAFVTVVSYLCDIKIFTSDQNTYDKVKYFYVNIYNLDENVVDQNVDDYMISYKKKNEKYKKELNIKYDVDVSETKKGEDEAKTKKGENETETKKAENETETKAEETNNEIESKIETINNEVETKEENEKETKKEEAKNEINEGNEEIKNEIIEEKKENIKNDIIKVKLKDNEVENKKKEIKIETKNDNKQKRRISKQVNKK